MSTIQGNGGDISFAQDFTMKVASWSADWNMETTDTTGFGDGGFRTKEPVITQMTGSATGTGQEGANPSEPIAPEMVSAAMTVGDLDRATGEVVLTATTGCTYTFDATITRVSLNRPVDGKLEVTLDFKSDGPILQTWDETAP